MSRLYMVAKEGPTDPSTKYREQTEKYQVVPRCFICIPARQKQPADVQNSPGNNIAKDVPASDPDHHKECLRQGNNLIHLDSFHLWYHYRDRNRKQDATVAANKRSVFAQRGGTALDAAHRHYSF